MRGALLAVAVVAAFVTLVAAASAADAGRGAQSLRLLPDDTRLVIVVDVKRARSSPIFVSAFEVASRREPLLERLTLDKNVETIVVGARGLTSTGAVLVVEGKLDKLIPEIKKRATATAMHDGVTYWTTEHGDVALVDKRLVVTGAGAMPAAIGRARDKARKAPASVRAIIAATTENAAIVGGIVPDVAMRKDIASSLGSEATLVTGSVGVGARLTLEGRFVFADAPAATKAGAAFERTVADARDRLEVLVGKDLADSIAVDTDDAVTRLAATMSSDEVDRLLAMARMFM